MSDGSALSLALTNAAAALNSSDAGSLELSHRRALWKALGPRLTPSAHAKRTSLAIASVEHVMFVWNLSFPDDSTPHDLLQRARTATPSDAEQLEPYADDAWTRMDDLAVRHRNKQIAICVGYAAVQALRVSIVDETFGSANDPELTDRTLSPDEFDPAFLSAGAFSNGFTWTRNSNSAHRKLYWVWWIAQFRS